MNENKENKFIDNNESNNNSLTNGKTYQSEQARLSELRRNENPISNHEGNEGKLGGNAHSISNQASNGGTLGKNNSGLSKKGSGAGAMNSLGSSGRNGIGSSLGGGLGASSLDRNNAMKNKALNAASKVIPGVGLAKRGLDMLTGANSSKKGLGAKEDAKAEAQENGKNEEEENDGGNGSSYASIPKKVLIPLSVVGGSFAIILIFLVMVVSSIIDSQSAMHVLGVMVSDEDTISRDVIKDLSSDDKKLINSVISELGKGDEDLGMGIFGDQQNLYEYYERIKVLGNVFNSVDICEGEGCAEKPEFKYMLKVADINLRYKYKYNINLDWVLLNATYTYQPYTQEEVMDRYLNEYNEEDVENYDILMNLDWDYDYKIIPDYTYLDPFDYRYDMQILAKNMVRKTTTQLCTTVDEDGNLIIVASQTDIDVEEQYFEPGQPYRLECPPGTSYSRSSTYRKDLEKYDEFLLEYIEHKYYLDPGVYSSPGEFVASPVDGNYIFPLPSGATSCRSSAFGPRIHPITKEYNNHSGDDYPAPKGTPVYAVASGTVSSAGFHHSMGNYVYVDHGNGVTSIYMHASKLLVSQGQTVTQGQPIMEVGTTGSSTGNHLHISFKKNGHYDNPANYIGALAMCGGR